MKTKWKLFLILLILSTIEVVALIPYSLTLQGDTTSKLPVLLYELLIVHIAQKIILFGILIGLGLYSSGKIGFGQLYWKAS